ncbi:MULTISPECIES: ABC transporter ATP-binding protein [unclassified Luteococcus]|uniref:ABC transporter ATP-binding protein n=1 Tax=unclassified Luteococcus TaxID=2639923 RepID=UPI00313B6FA4
MTTTAEHAITATGLRRHHGHGKARFEAVRGIDLQVNRGELFALLGTNGAGKTSTLEVLEGLAPATGGQVRVLGHDPYRERTRVIGRLGIMLQQAGFSDDLTVAETAAMWHATLDRPRPVSTVLADVHLSDRAGVRVKSLSGGEKRRLDLGLALMGDPELLFLDEPTTGLDPQSRQVTWQLVRSLLDRGTTVMLTTHYLEEAEELATRLAIMDRGQIHSQGTVAEIIAGQNARITFETDHAEQLALAELPALAARPHRDGQRVALETRELQPTLAALLTQASRHGVELRRLDARSATLEQAFLSIAEGKTADGTGVAA